MMIYSSHMNPQNVGEIHKDLTDLQNDSLNKKTVDDLIRQRK